MSMPTKQSNHLQTKSITPHQGGTTYTYMKKILMSLAVMSATLFASCDKSDMVEQTPSTPQSGTPVNISIRTADTETRSFLDDIGTLRDWEKRVSSLTMLVYDSAEKLVATQRFTEEEITSGNMRLILTDAEVGETFELYAVANTSVYESASKSYYMDAYSTRIAYNNTFENVMAEDVGERVCAMSGMSTITIAPHGERNSVDIDMERMTIKTAISTTLDVAPELVGGGVKVTNMSVRNPVGTYYVFLQDRDYSGWSTDTYNQVPNFEDGEYQNLFYLVEYEGWDFKVSITYDEDGDFETTTDDQFEKVVSMNVPKRDYRRNEVMRLNFVIKINDDMNPVIDFDITDWEDSEIVDGDLPVII